MSDTRIQHSSYQEFKPVPHLMFFSDAQATACATTIRPCTACLEFLTFYICCSCTQRRAARPAQPYLYRRHDIASGHAYPALMVRVSFTGSTPDLHVTLDEGASVQNLLDQVRLQRRIPECARVRLVFGGAELLPPDAVPPQPCTIHCIVTGQAESQPEQQSDSGQPQLTVKFASGAPDLLVRLPDGSLVSDLVRQIRAQRLIPPEQRLRLVHAGGELAPENSLPRRSCAVHCIATTVPPPQREPPPPDWRHLPLERPQMDVLGPRTFLKLVGGATLLVADHQVFVAGGRPSLLLAALLTAFNLVYVLACFPQLMTVMQNCGMT